MRRRFAVLTLLFTCLLAGAAEAAIDRALVGTWDGSGTIVTPAMQKTGAFLLRIDPTGQFLMVRRSRDDFMIDAGTWTTDGGGYKRTLSTGLPDQGSFKRQGDGFRFESFYGVFELRPAKDRQEELLKLLTGLLRIPTTPTASDWAIRGAEFALLWQPDAGLDYITFAQPSDDGLIVAGRSNISFGFYSRQADRLLLLSPAGNGVMSAFVTKREGGPAGPRAVPVPITDWSQALKAIRQSGVKERFRQAELRFYGDKPAEARVLWRGTTEGQMFGYACFDVAGARVVDCRKLAGDPAAEFEALGRRAAAARAAMQRQWSGGDATDAAMPADFGSRCMAASGSPSGGRCYGVDGQQITP